MGGDMGGNMGGDMGVMWGWHRGHLFLHSSKFPFGWSRLGFGFLAKVFWEVSIHLVPALMMDPGICKNLRTGASYCTRGTFRNIMGVSGSFWFGKNVRKEASYCSGLESLGGWLQKCLKYQGSFRKSREFPIKKSGSYCTQMSFRMIQNIIGNWLCQ